MAKSAKNQVFKLHDGTTLQTLTCDLNGVTLTRERNVEAFETLCAVEKIAGNVDASIAVTGRYDGTVDKIDDVMDTLLANDTPVLWEYYPNGSGSGKIRYYGSGLVTSYEVGGESPGVVEVSADIEVDGSVVRNVI